MAAGQYVVYGLEDNQELLRDVEDDQVRMAVITHARNQMFTSQFGRLTVVSCEQPKNESMSVYLRAAKKQLMQLQFYRSDTVGLLKRRVATVMGIPVSGIILVVKGKRLDDETVRGSSIVKQDQFLHVIDSATLCYENGRIYIEKTLASSTKSIYMSSQQTLQELFDRAERETMINSCCFKLYHLGGFLEASSNITLKEALLAEGCEIKLTVSQKKLMIVQMLIELLMLLVNSIELGEEACIEDLVEDESFIQCVRQGLTKQAAKASAQAVEISDKLTIEDDFEREIQSIHRQYLTLLRSYSPLEGEPTQFQCLSVALNIIQSQHQLNLEVFLMEDILFNRQRKTFFFQRLEQILEEAGSPNNTIGSIVSLVVDSMCNKFNFTRIDRICGFQLNYLLPHINTLIEALYDSPEEHSVTNYLTELEHNSYSLQGMPQYLSCESGFILIDPSSLEKIATHHDIYFQTAVLCYVLALHFPLIGCTTTEETADLQANLADNLRNLTDEEFVRGIAQLLFREELDLDEDY